MDERRSSAPRPGRGEPPMHAGLSPTFCGQPLVLDPAGVLAAGAVPLELRAALRRGGREVELCAADAVEACPPFDPTGITAPAGERAALDILTGMAMRRDGARGR